MQGAWGSRRTVRRLLGACCAAVVLAVAIPPAAGAAVTCSYDSGAEVLQVFTGANGDAALLQVSGGVILVRGGGPVLTCAGGEPTLVNTGDIDVFDNSPDQGARLSVIDPAVFGATTNIILALAEGNFNEIFLEGSEASNHYIFGAAGIDTDADGNADISYFGASPKEIRAVGSNGTNTFTGQGGSGTGAAVSASSLVLVGGGASDTLVGGENSDGLRGGGGSDSLNGAGGDDGLIGDELSDQGDDILDGGPGTDRIYFPQEASAVSVDLAETTPQATGEGNDTITEVEGVEGTEFADTLRGDDGPNFLGGGLGDDLIEGRGGADRLEGGIGDDTISYAGAPAAVTVDLAAGTASGGAGEDTISNFDNLVGSEFADNLTGDAGPNTITPLAGTDVVRALGGADLVEVRDGAADNASCGEGSDRAVADRLSLDTIQSDCEQVDALPEPGGPAGGGPGSGPGSGGTGGGAGGGMRAATLDLRLSGAHSQRLLKQKSVVVRARCPEVACSLRAGAVATLTAKGGQPKRLALKGLTARAAAGKPKMLRLRLGAKQLAALGAALRAGESTKLKVTVTATDATGETVRRSLTVTAR